MNSTLTPEQRKQRTETAIKIAGLAGVCLVLGPMAGTLAAGGMALAGLIAGAAALFTVVKFIPWFALKVGNARLKALKAEASKNPVETLQNQLAEKQRALAAFMEKIRIFTGQVMTFADQVKQYVKDGLEDSDVYVAQLAKMREWLELRKKKYQDAKDTLQEFEETVKRTDRKWRMACAAAAINEAAGQLEGDEFDKICIETALTSVQDKLNQSFADLEIAFMDDETSKKSALQKTPMVNEIASVSSTLSSNRQQIKVS